MALPINVNEVLSAAAGLDEARQMPVRVAVFVDPTAAVEVDECVRRAFVSAQPNAAVDWPEYSVQGATVRIGTDAAVVVAGESPDTGHMAHTLINDGVPVVVIAANAQQVCAAAEGEGYALFEDDVIEVLEGEWSHDVAGDMLERLGEWFVAVFREKKLAFALAFTFIRRPLAKDAVNATAIQNAGIGLIPLIPGADMPLMTMNQAKMVLQVAAAYGQDVGTARWKELAAVTGGAFAGREVARRLIGLVPVLGGVVRTGVGWAGTQAMGRAALVYFERMEEGVYELPEGENSRDRARAVVDSVRTKIEPYGAAVAAGAGVLAGEVATVAGNVATKVTEVAGPYAKQAANKAKPYVSRAAEEVAPAVRRVLDSAAEAIAPTLGNALRSVAERIAH